MTKEIETRTLEEVSFETFSTAKIALERHADRAGDDVEKERAEDSLADLVEKWNAATERERGADDE